jgi:dUTP pyrophosphatase
MVNIKIKKLHNDVKIPEYAHEGDAGFDIYSYEEYELKPNERKVFKTGITTSFPIGYVALIWDRSGNAAKKGLKTMAGVVDSGYRGEWGIVLLNTSNETHKINKFDKIAQCLLQPIISADIKEVSNLEESERGEKGFGSTDKK